MYSPGHQRHAAQPCTAQPGTVQPGTAATALAGETCSSVAGLGTVAALDDRDVAGLVSDEALFAALTDVQHSRRTQLAAECRLLAEVDARRLYRREGHATPYGWLRSHFGFSDAECRLRVTIARAWRINPSIVDALANGTIPIAHAEVLSRAINDCADDPTIDPSRWIQQLGFWLNETDRDYHDFRLRIQQWVSRLRAEHATLEAEHQRARRYCRMRRRPDGMVHIDALLDPLGGAEFLEVWAHQAGRFFDADWHAAQAIHGDRTTPGVLDRTDAQRQADALVEVGRRAHGSDGTTTAPMVSILIDEHSFTDAMIRLGLFPTDAALDNSHLLPPQHTARTNTGTPIDPIVAVQAALAGHTRFTMVDKLNRPLKTTSRQRLFSGAMREAIMAMSPNCCWPGCRRTINDCQADHSIEHQHGGPTSITNGVPFCRRHNQFKSQHHYQPRQTRRGVWALPRPPGRSSRVLKFAVRLSGDD